MILGLLIVLATIFVTGCGGYGDCGDGICDIGDETLCPIDCEEEPECARLGESGPNPSLGPNDPNIDVQCCDTLKQKMPKGAFAAECMPAVGAGTVCLACGDGTCDEEYENTCNCPEDCAEEPECVEDIDCSNIEVTDSCMESVCSSGKCEFAHVDSCVPCEEEVDCDDENACTAESCTQDGTCIYAHEEGCVPCEDNEDCSFLAITESCTTVTCGDAGKCVFGEMENCGGECGINEDCVSEDVCMAGTCDEVTGSCLYEAIEGCDASLVAHWPFEEYEIEDLVKITKDVQRGHILHTFATNVTMDAEGKIGKAVGFDGINSALVGDDQISPVGSAMTIMAWVKPNASLLDQRIVAKGNSTEFDDQDFVLLLDDSNTTGKLYPQFRLRTTDGFHSITSWYSTELDTWSHIAAVYTGEKMLLYVNGIKKAEEEWTGEIVNNNPLWVGGQPQGLPDRPFSGLIDEVYIYERALSLEEIKANKNLG